MYTPSQTYPSIAIVILALLCCFSSCGLFDKELRQDKHMADFRRQMGRVSDSLNNHKDRIKALNTIIENINADESLVTIRKKNILLLECNALISNEYFKVESYKKAIDYTNIVIKIDSTSPKGYYNRGCIYQTIEQDSLALIDYNIAIKLSSDYTDAYYNRGIIYEEWGRYDEALSDYSKAIKLNPPYVGDIYNNRGNTYLAKHLIGKAINDYSKVISIDSMNINAYSNRASAYIIQKELDKALLDCNKAITLDSININAYNNRALIYEANKKYDMAINDYQMIIHIDTSDNKEAKTAAREAIKKIKSSVRKK